jgi:hypothetical protein
MKKIWPTTLPQKKKMTCHVITLPAQFSILPHLPDFDVKNGFTSKSVKNVSNGKLGRHVQHSRPLFVAGDGQMSPAVRVFWSPASPGSRKIR